MSKKFDKKKLYCPRCYSPLIKENYEVNDKYQFLCTNNTCATKQLRCRWDINGYINKEKICPDNFLLGCYYAINSPIRKVTIENRCKKIPIFTTKNFLIYIKSHPLCNSTATRVNRDRFKLVILYKIKKEWIQYQNGVIMIFKSLKIFKFILKKYREKPSYITVCLLKKYLEPSDNNWWSPIVSWILNEKYPDLKEEINRSFALFKERKDLIISVK